MRLTTRRTASAPYGTKHSACTPISVLRLGLAGSALIKICLSVFLVSSVCGKHQCPPTPRTTHYDPSIASEARQAYQGTFKPAVRAKAPDQWVARNVPFEGESTTKADYKAHPVSLRSALGTRGSLMDTGVGRNSAPFDLSLIHI